MDPHFFIEFSFEDQATYHTEHNLNPIQTCRNVKNNWLYMRVCGVLVVLRLELKSVSLLRRIELRSIQLT